ncbi:LacI family transcriptional regulator [Sphingomonas sp. CL5.1]|uniref:LacI family DNA-binding transcriptional regulator n=1 Tax=Sphingomonas sp. CL5.1 TaxID=2653203 RepID=UPI001582F57D|nr:LacI family DNA-binding transcriptional regulator [Sphingomonas sp. CL5.1]QKR98339.1 LacI family transcriptional regulator [Sphingomonas sp. CL5.1]
MIKEEDNSSLIRDIGKGGVTINDVAAAANVSIRTVSRVLNRSPKVNAETRRQIEEVIERLGFSPSQRARALAVGRSSLIGMVHDDPNALVLDAVQRGVVAECVRRGYELVVHPAGLVSDDVVADIVTFVNRSRVDGLIVLSPVSELPAIPKALSTMKVPVVGLASVRIPSYPAMLVSDERRGAEAIGNHLIELGHRRIAIITGPRTFHSATEREQGFRSALHTARIKLAAEHVVEGDYGFDSGTSAAHHLLTHDNRPTAIFASNDVMAAAVLKVATQLGLSVPQDLSVAGFDGSVIAKMVTPALTTVHRPLLNMASNATALLIDMIEDQSLVWTTDISVDLKIEIRESTGPVPSTPPRPGRGR